MRSSCDPDARSVAMKRLAESSVRRTTHPRRRLGQVNQVDAPGPSQAVRHIDRRFLMWTRPRQFYSGREADFGWRDPVGQWTVIYHCSRLAESRRN